MIRSTEQAIADYRALTREIATRLYPLVDEQMNAANVLPSFLVELQPSLDEVLEAFHARYKLLVQGREEYTPWYNLLRYTAGVGSEGFDIFIDQLIAYADHTQLDLDEVGLLHRTKERVIAVLKPWLAGAGKFSNHNSYNHDLYACADTLANAFTMVFNEELVFKLLAADSRMQQYPGDVYLLDESMKAVIEILDAVAKITPQESA
jgi:hypothetical protein